MSTNSPTRSNQFRTVVAAGTGQSNHGFNSEKIFPTPRKLQPAFVIS